MITKEQKSVIHCDVAKDIVMELGKELASVEERRRCLAAIEAIDKLRELFRVERSVVIEGL